MAKLVVNTSVSSNILVRPFLKRLLFLVIALVILLLLHQLATHTVINKTVVETVETVETVENPPKDPYEEAIKHFSPFSSEYSPATCSNLPYRVKRKSFKAYGPPGRELSILHWRYLTFATAEAIDW